MRRRTNVKGVLLALAIASPAVASEDGFTNMYTFGDSLSDQGNLFEATTTLTRGTAGIPRADYYWKGRFTNGKNWVDVVARRLDLVSKRSLRGGNNFAFGGTRTDYNNVEFDRTKPFEVQLLVNYVPQGNAFQELIYPWTLNAQRDTFISLGVSDPGALYVAFSGSNDLVDIIFMSAFQILTQEQASGWIGNVVDRIDDAIQAMVNAGAQEILVPNLPNLGVVPGLAQSGLGFLAMLKTTEYNDALDDMLTEWEDKVNIIPFDTFSLTNAVVSEPTKFGFTDATTPCYSGFVGVVAGEEITVCKNPAKYVFWDREHPTAAFHAVLARKAMATFAPDMLDYLTLQVSKLDIGDRLRDRLNNKLDRASRKLANGNSEAAASKLEKFIEVVEAKQGKQIPEDDALSMIMRAEKIIALLDEEH